MRNRKRYLLNVSKLIVTSVSLKMIREINSESLIDRSELHILKDIRSITNKFCGQRK